jgi:pimeloyl-ACP methyl ester carboxylesterase
VKELPVHPRFTLASFLVSAVGLSSAAGQIPPREYDPSGPRQGAGIRADCGAEFVLDCEHVPQDQTLNDTFEYGIDCRNDVRIEVWYFSREYPHWTGQQSEFDDVIAYEVRLRGVVLAAGSANVNSLHGQFSLNGPYPGGSFRVAEIVPAADAGTLEFEAWATNIGDPFLGSGVAFVITCTETNAPNPTAAPPSDDRTFVYQSQAGACQCRPDGPIEFNIDVKRYAGMTTGGGQLSMVGALKEHQLIGEYATLLLMCWDVDSSANQPGVLPEMDRVHFNGQIVSSLDPGNSQFLVGAHEQWRLNSYRIPIEKVLFPGSPGANGQRPTERHNQVRIEIDVGNTEPTWCMKVGWAALQIDVTSPIVLIHGINSFPDFFNIMLPTNHLQSLGLVFDSTILLADLGAPQRANRVTNDAQDIDRELIRRVTQFGVDSVHLVAHSKGGLDARSYLATHQPARDSVFRVLSLSTLSTPHEGSVLADLIVQYHQNVSTAADVQFAGLPEFRANLQDLLNVFPVRRSPGYEDLQTKTAAEFNSRNLRQLPRDITYNTFAGDADLNLSDGIDNSPDEYSELRTVDLPLRTMHQFNPEAARRVVDFSYQMLKDAQEVEVVIGPDPAAPTRNIAYLTGVPAPQVGFNDTLVTIRSGRGLTGFSGLVTHHHQFEGASGRNHASIANSGVAQILVPWLRETDGTRGDLKPR